MDIEILTPETLRCYPGLEQQLRKWAELTSIPVDGLLVRIFCGSLLDEYYDQLIWTFDPRDLTRGMPRIVGRYKPPGIIELDTTIDKPRWGLLAFYFFHELGHHKDYSAKVKLTEETADTFAKEMMKRVKNILPRKSNKQQVRKGGG